MAVLTEGKNTLKSWIICLTTALFFFYIFVQINMFNALDLYLLKDFHVSAEQLGQLSSYYFIANVLFLFPAGMILDRISPRKVVVFVMLICTAATLIFSLTGSWGTTAVCRFTIGIAGAFTLLSYIKVASRWFLPNRMALITGAMVTLAMLGGMVAQTPLTLLADNFGWRHAVMADAVLGHA